MGYFRDTVKGFSWMGSLRIAIRTVTYLKLAILARLLTPEQFGVFGIATLVLGLLEILTETGINIFLLQEEDNVDEYVDTAWIISIVRGSLISIILLAVSPLITIFFNSPQSLPILLLIAAVPFVRGFINPSIIKFQKYLLFNKEFWFRFVLFFVDGVVAVTAALITRSATSFVLGMLAGALVEVLLSQILFKPRPKIIYNQKLAKKILSRGKWITGAVVSNYLFQEGDDIVVGRLLGSFPLGIYQMAYKISSLPITEVSDVVIKITLPVYVKIKEDKKRLLSAFIKTLLVVAALVIPFSLVFLFFADPLVRFVLGPKWLETVNIIKLMSFFGALRALVATSYPLFNSLKKQQYVTAITFIGFIGLALTIIPLVLKFGIFGAALSAMVGVIFSIPATVYYLNKTFKQLK